MLEALMTGAIMAILGVVFYGGMFLIGQRSGDISRRVAQAHEAEEKEMSDDNGRPLTGNEERLASVREYNRKEKESIENSSGYVLLAFIIVFCIVVGILFPNQY
jgi:hypothetical protein